MKILRLVFQKIGLQTIRAQLLILIIILMVSGMSAMGIIYNGMQADAATINIAGRQRMLSQRVAKEVLLVNFGIDQSTAVNKTIGLFETSMGMLLNGDKARGISAPMNGEIQEQLEKVSTIWSQYRMGIQALLQLDTVDPTNEKHADLIEKLHQQAPFILKEMNKAVQLMEAASNEQVAANMHITLVLLASLMLLSGVLFLYVRRYLMLPLLPLREALQTIAKGDLTKTLPADDSGDEIGVLYTDYNEARHDFASMLRNVVESVEHLGVASLQLKEAATENASGMELQYQDIELISTAMTEMTATIKEVAGSTANASDYTKEADQYAHTGRQVMGDAGKTIEQLNNQVQEVGEVINALDADSKEITTVLDVINGIADQTNLLALNAAIEAARAGEAGRGFAVVADEVRGLAARTATSTSEIQQMIEKLQSQVQQSVQAMANCQKQAVTGVEHVKNADEALERIAAAVVAINEMNAHIAVASKEQNDVAEDMNQRIVHVADASHTTREHAINNRELADGLSAMGEKLSSETVSFHY